MLCNLCTKNELSNTILSKINQGGTPLLGKLGTRLLSNFRQSRENIVLGITFELKMIQTSNFANMCSFLSSFKNIKIKFNCNVIQKNDDVIIFLQKMQISAQICAIMEEF